MLGMLGLLLGAWLLYLIAAAWALRSNTVRRAINSKPDKFFIEWRSGSSWFPGFFHIQGLRFVGQGSDSQYYGRMDEARFRVRLLPLLRKRIAVGAFNGRGIEFQLRRTPPKDGPAPAEHLYFPPIPGLESLPARTVPRRPRGKPSWWIQVEKILFREVERIWIYGSRLDGPGTLSAGLAMQIEGPFHTRVEALDLPEASLLHNGSVVATNLALRLAGELGPLVFGVDDGPNGKIFDFITAHLDLNGDVGTLALLRKQLGTYNTIDFGGGGRIDARILVEKGILQDGTTLDIRSPQLRVSVGQYVFEGEAHVEDRVVTEGPETVTRLRLRLNDLKVKRRGVTIGAATGPALELSSTSYNLKAHRGFGDADISFQLQPFVAHDASWLNDVLPPRGDVTITGGALTIGADLHAAPGGSISGRLDVSGNSVAAQIDGTSYEGTIGLAARLSSGEGGPKVLHLGGTELVLTNLFVPDVPRERQEGWHATFGIPQGRLDLTNNSYSLDAFVQLGIRDTRPILAILRKDPNTPKWLAFMPTLRDLQGGGQVQASPASARITGFSLVGRSTDLRTEMHLTTNSLNGIAYARYGILSAGFDLRDPGKSQWRILGAKRWYERALASPFVVPASPEPEEPDPLEDPVPRPNP